MELISSHKNSRRISAENAEIFARVYHNPRFVGGKMGLKIAQKFIKYRKLRSIRTPDYLLILETKVFSGLAPSEPPPDFEKF